MKISQYSVRILNANSNPIQEKEGGYCPVKHKEQYKIALRNFSENDASAEVLVDGQSCGFYLVKANSKLIIESPNNDQDEGKFTFFAIDSFEGELISEDVDVNNFGLIQVKFVSIKKDTNPEQIQTIINNYYNYGSYRWWVDYYYDRYSYPSNVTPLWKINLANTFYPTTANNVVTGSTTATINSISSTAGVSGLTGYSEQTYEKPKDIEYLILDTLTVISLRLIASKEENSDAPRKITGFSNPIPPVIF